MITGIIDILFALSPAVTSKARARADHTQLSIMVRGVLFAVFLLPFRNVF